MATINSLMLYNVNENKTINILSSILFLLLISINVNASEQFNFDVTEVEILENGNKFVGKKEAQYRLIMGLLLKQMNLFMKKINVLIAYGDVKVFDKINNYEIYSDKITYKK